MKLSPICAILCLLLGATSPALASFGKDSVAVFHRPEKVIALVTEKGPNSRLAQFMNLWNLNTVDERHVILWQSDDQELTVRCFENQDHFSCTFKLLPTTSAVKILEGSAFLSLPLKNPSKQDFEMEFKSSRNDYFYFSSQNQYVTIEAIKKHSN